MLAQSNRFSADSTTLTVKRLNSEENRKLKGSFQKIEEVQSPSTDYSDAPDAQFYETSESNKKDAQSSQSLVEENPCYEEKNFEEEENETSINNDLEDEDDDDEIELSGWSEKKDKVLKALAAKCKYDWKKIAKKFNGDENANVTPLELKHRYKELTKVSIPLRVKFSHEEDLRIAKYFNIYGCDWAQIATHFTDRTGIMLKNRYYSHIRKKNLLYSMLDEIKDTGNDSPVEDILDKNVEEEAEENEEEEEDIIEAAIENVVEELTPIDQPIEIPSITFAQPEEEPEGDEYIRRFIENAHGITFRKIPVCDFTCLEIENCLASVLYDKITFTRY